MEELPSELLHIIFSYAGPKATVCGIAVNKKWNAVCQYELLWKAFLLTRPDLCYGIDIKNSSIQDIIKWPDGSQPSWKELIRIRAEGNHPNSPFPPPPQQRFQCVRVHFSNLHDNEEERKRKSLKPPERGFLLRFVVIGSYGAGKSSLAEHFALEKFSPDKLRTIGVDFVSRLYTFPGRDTIHVQIWDTAGQGSPFSFSPNPFLFVPHFLAPKERFRSVVRSYYRNMHGIVVAFDLSSIAEGRSIHAELDSWREEIVVYFPSPLSFLSPSFLPSLVRVLFPFL